MSFTVTIYIADRGTTLAEGGTSAVGHMWLSITNSNGNVESFGFAPLNHGEAFGPGKIYENDTSNYQSHLLERSL